MLVAVWSKAWVSSRSIAGIADSSPPEGMDGGLSLLFVVSCVGSSFCDEVIIRLRVLPCVCVCVCVCV